MNSLPAERIQEIQKAIELFSVGQGPAKTMEEASKRSYQFWDTQPVPKLGKCSLLPLHAPWEKPCGPLAAQRSPQRSWSLASKQVLASTSLLSYLGFKGISDTCPPFSIMD